MVAAALPLVSPNIRVLSVPLSPNMRLAAYEAIHFVPNATADMLVATQITPQPLVITPTLMSMPTPIRK